MDNPQVLFLLIQSPNQVWIICSIKSLERRKKNKWTKWRVMKHWRRWMITTWKTRWSKHVLHLLQAHQVKIYHCPPTPPPPSWLSYPKFMILHQHIWEAFVPNSGSHIGKGVNRAGDWAGDGGTGATYPSSPARAHQILLNLSIIILVIPFFETVPMYLPDMRRIA